MNLIGKISIAAGIAVSLLLPQSKADYESGVQAWESGSYRQAMAEWQSAASEDDGRAMLAIGRAYRQGLGVLQDHVEAHKWFNLAASRGEREALEERDALGALMSEEEQAEARRLAREWRPENRVSTSSADGNSSSSRNVGLPQPDAIREAQALLKALGYRPGPADGLWGQRTEDAWRSFLRDAGLPVEEPLNIDMLLILREIATLQGIEVGDNMQVDGTGDSPAKVGEPKPVRQALPPDILHRMASAGDIASLREALDAGADVDGLDGRGWTALMHAVDRGYILIVESLIEAGADVDVRAPDGATALFMAAALKQPEIAGLLMRAGADIAIRGPQGRTPVEVARLTFGEAVSAQMGFLDSFRDCDSCPEMVIVPAGSFMMGSNSSEAYDDEQPVHGVAIPAPLAVGRYEVTVGQYAHFVEQTGHASTDTCRVWNGDELKDSDSHSWRKPGFSQAEADPVVCVSWQDAREYVLWLSRETGEGYRLLSESEWEYAARAGTTSAYHFGSNISLSQANFGRNVGRTVPVGSYPANAFGLHDVHGNVWEWMEDCWNGSYHGAPSDGSAWTSGDCNRRVLRGGSWYRNPRIIRSAIRSRFRPDGRIYSVGFRVARTLTP